MQITEKVTSIHDALLLSFADAPRVPASQVSEGTLLALGIFTALETLERREGVVDEGRVVWPAEVVSAQAEPARASVRAAAIRVRRMMSFQVVRCSRC